LSNWKTASCWLDIPIMFSNIYLEARLFCSPKYYEFFKKSCTFVETIFKYLYEKTNFKTSNSNCSISKKNVLHISAHYFKNRKESLIYMEIKTFFCYNF
jgi:hypothetical protein